MERRRQRERHRGWSAKVNDAAAVAVFIPSEEKRHVIDELVSHARADGRSVYVGIQSGSWHGTEDEVRKAATGCCDLHVEHVAPELVIDSDASAYLAALEAWRDSGLRQHRRIMFSHSKGVTSGRDRWREKLLPALYAGAAALDDDSVGVWSPYACKVAFGVHGYSQQQFECLRRFAPKMLVHDAMPYFTTFTFFAMRGSIVRDFVAEAGDALFDTRIQQYSDRYLLERDFCHVSDMAGYMPACSQLFPYWCQGSAPPMSAFAAMAAGAPRAARASHCAPSLA